MLIRDHIGSFVLLASLANSLGCSKQSESDNTSSPAAIDNAAAEDSIATPSSDASPAAPSPANQDQLDACIRECLQLNMARAVSHEQIERDCQDDCAATSSDDDEPHALPP